MRYELARWDCSLTVGATMSEAIVQVCVSAFADGISVEIPAWTQIA